MSNKYFHSKKFLFYVRMFNIFLWIKEQYIYLFGFIYLTFCD